MGKDRAALQASVAEDVQKECGKSARGARVVSISLLAPPESFSGWNTTAGPLVGIDPYPEPKSRADSLQVFRLAAEGGEYSLSVPWSGKVMRVHEFASIVPGTLPRAMALRWRMTATWIGAEGLDKDPLAQEAARARIAAQGIGLHKDLLWFLQAVPLGPHEYVHMAQTAPVSTGLFKKGFGVDWYLGRRDLFVDFLKFVSITDASHPRIFFGAHSLAALAAAHPDKLTRG